VLALKNYNITVFTWLDVTLIYCTVAYTIAVGIHAVRALDDKIEANDDHLKTWPAVLRKKYAPAVDRMKFSLVTQKLREDLLLCYCVDVFAESHGSWIVETLSSLLVSGLELELGQGGGDWCHSILLLHE